MNFPLYGKVIAVFDMILSASGIACVAIGGIVFGARKDELVRQEKKLERYPQLREFVESSALEQSLYFLIPIGYFIIELVLALLLWFGVTQSNYRILKTWTISTVTMAVVGMTFSAFEIAASTSKMLSISLIMMSYVFTPFSIWIGISLCKQFKINDII